MESDLRATVSPIDRALSCSPGTSSPGGRPRVPGRPIRRSPQRPWSASFLFNEPDQRQRRQLVRLALI